MTYLDFVFLRMYFGLFWEFEIFWIFFYKLVKNKPPPSHPLSSILHHHHHPFPPPSFSSFLLPHPLSLFRPLPLFFLPSYSLPFPISPLSSLLPSPIDPSPDLVATRTNQKISTKKGKSRGRGLGVEGKEGRTEKEEDGKARDRKKVKERGKEGIEKREGRKGGCCEDSQNLLFEILILRSYFSLFNYLIIHLFRILFFNLIEPNYMEL